MSIISFCILPVLQIHQSHHLSFKHYAPCFRSSFTPITAVAKVQRRAINYPRPAPLMKKKSKQIWRSILWQRGEGLSRKGRWISFLIHREKCQVTTWIGRRGGDRRKATEGEGSASRRGEQRGGEASHSRLAVIRLRTREAAVKRRKNLSDVYVHVLYMCIYLDTKG